jgi:amino acid transporter
MLLSLTTSNIAGHSKKVTASGILFISYCTGNIAGPFFYKTNQKPLYSFSIWSMIVAHLLAVVCVALLWAYLRSENKRRDKNQGIGGNAIKPAEYVETLEDMADKNTEIPLRVLGPFSFTHQ